MRLIDASKVINEIERFKGYLDEDMIWRIKFAINRLPTIEIETEEKEAEPIRHGKWIKSEKSDFEWECSECGYGLTDNKLTYCYDCGARMDLDEVER